MRTVRPEKKGMYDPSFEHDNCGIGFVAHLKGVKSHSIIQRGLETLENMIHRGAEGADSKTGDGAGILIQVPRDFYLIQGYSLPQEGRFGTGLIFLPQISSAAKECEEALVKAKNKDIVISLREIAAGKIEHAPISEYDAEEF